MKKIQWKFGELDFADLIRYLIHNKILNNKIETIHIFYESKEIILDIIEHKNYYNKFIERTKTQFNYIKDMYFIKNDGSCHSQIKIMI